MSEEIALADANLAAIADLRGALDVAMAERDAERELVKALLIKMRRYIVGHGLLIGECCAWNDLKRKFDVGQTRTEDDERWLAAYERRKAQDMARRQAETAPYVEEQGKAWREMLQREVKKASGQ